MSERNISANFEGVEAGAQAIIKRAEGIRDELNAFHAKVKEFVGTQEGDANEAFAAFQSQWNQHVEQLQATLSGAGSLVSTGNAELQGTDKALANLF